MKKSFAKLTALLLALSMLLPAGVFAATTYSITVTLAGPDHHGVQQQVERTSSKYGTLRDPVLGTVAQALYDDTGRTVDKEVEEKYDGTLLRGEYYALSEAAMNAMRGNMGAWTTWVNSYVSTAAQKQVLLNTDSTFADLNAIGGLIYATYRGGKGLYTVTIRLNTYTTGGGSTKPQEPQPEEPTVVVDTGKTEGGEVVISNPDAKPGDTVEIAAKPEPEKYVHHIDVRDENGDKVPMTYVGKGEYSFVMPEGEVTITPSFQTQATDPAVSGVSRLLNADDHVAFMQGFGTGDFRPTASITRAQVATIFYRLLLDQNVEITKSFDDVSEDYWAHNAIATLASLGILNGMTEDHYDPNRQITRAQFAAICARFAYTLTGLGGQTSFTDVPTDHWAHDEIETAVSYGWINGYDDGSFNPGAPITRAQAATIVNRMFARIADQIVVDNGERRDYTDVNDAYWAWYDIQEASTGHDFEDETGFRHEYWDDSEVAALKS